MDYENAIAMGQQAQFAQVPQAQWSREMQQEAAVRQKQMLGATNIQSGNQIRQPGLMDGLRGAHDLMDRLDGALGGLEERLYPVLSPQPPNGLGGEQKSAEPAAIEEVVRMLLRMQGMLMRVESITGRVRV